LEHFRIVNLLRRSLAVGCLLAVCPLARAEVAVKEMPDRVRVEIGGKLFTELRHGDAPHVYYYPLIGPGGVKMTRAWPMEDVPGEEHDHPHHRSLWFSHGQVNGVDFWSEATSHKGTPKHPVGKIVFDKVIAAQSGKVGVLTTLQKWVAPDGSVPVTSLQTLRVHDGPETERMFDFEVTLTAGDKDVTFGDTKEGTFAIRIAESMRLKGAKNSQGMGQILASSGLRNEKVWGTRAGWVDMSGPVDGKMYGFTIFDHPSNLRHPTRWHARDYGLFAANPFCEVDMDKTQAKGAGDYLLGSGKSVTFKYRVWMHTGAADAAEIGRRFSEYAAK
jgi:Methane oxygenase PmoA